MFPRCSITRRRLQNRRLERADDKIVSLPRNVLSSLDSSTILHSNLRVIALLKLGRDNGLSEIRRNYHNNARVLGDS